MGDDPLIATWSFSLMLAWPEQGRSIPIGPLQSPEPVTLEEALEKARESVIDGLQMMVESSPIPPPDLILFSLSRGAAVNFGGFMEVQHGERRGLLRRMMGR